MISRFIRCYVVIEVIYVDKTIRHFQANHRFNHVINFNFALTVFYRCY